MANHNRVEPEKRSKALQYYHANIDKLREVQRVRAKERYYRNKEAKLAKNAAYRKNNPEKWKEIKRISNRKYTKRRFFFVRALSSIAHVGLYTEDVNQVCADLSRAWYSQRGRCAYTGVRLGRDAQVDHKVPTSRGGTNDSCNLHWVTPAANYVKRSLTHDEFVALAVDVASYIAQNTPTGLKRATK